MKNKRRPAASRNWFLVFIALLLMILGVAIVVTAALGAEAFGWWSLLYGVVGLVVVVASVVAIVKNDLSWILLSLLFPG